MLKKTIILSVVMSLMLIGLFVNPTAAKSLILMGWDGAGWKSVKPMLDAGQLPNLKGLIQTGSFIPIEVTGRTVTISSWVEVFTGRTPDQTGVNGNTPAPPSISTTEMAQMQAFHYWLHPIGPVESVIRILKNQGVKIGWIISKKAYLGDNCTSSPLCYLARLANSYYAVEVNPGGSWDYLPSIRNKTFDALNFFKDVPFFFFVQVNPDQFAHKYAEGSMQYKQEIIRADAFLGEILSKINRAEVKILVMTDHGFDLGLKSHKNAPDAWAATDFPLTLNIGNMRDITPTILDYFNIDFASYVNMRGKSLLRPVLNLR